MIQFLDYMAALVKVENKTPNNSIQESAEHLIAEKDITDKIKYKIYKE